MDEYRDDDSGPDKFGSTAIGSVSPDSATGDTVGINGESGGFSLFVPQGYTGSSLTATDVFDNATLDSLGLTPGIYTFSWDSSAPGDDSFVVNVIAPSAAVPEPSSLSLLMAPMSMALLFVFWRRRQS